MRILLILAILLLTACGGYARPPSVVMHGVSEGYGSRGVHVVRGGDTLFSVAERYQLRFADLAYVNDLAAPYMLDVGQRLKLPPPKEYRVRGGDTLYLISYMFDVGVEETAALNGITDPLKLRVGQRLELPSVIPRAGAMPLHKPETESVEEEGEKGAVVRPQEKPAQESVKPPKKAREVVRKVEVKTPKRSSSKFMKPVRGRVISSYGSKANGLHNDGINIAAARGTSVAAADNGVVVYAGNGLKGSGNLVLVRHENRWMTAYGHLDNIGVKSGQVLKRGQKLGSVGSTGSVSTPQLHFEVRRGTQALNPSVYFE
ncbi:MAG: peptidoglycan DD-metalloendopeptidase family protein [Alphaproteobacteria bacterium]